VVRAEEGVTDKVKDSAGSVASKVKDTANYAKDKVKDAAGTVTETAKDLANDFQGKAEQAGDKASEAGKDLEGKTKNAANEATRQTENLAVRAAIRLFLASSLISFLVICIAMSSVSNAKPIQ
jgi:gas vesicle protein